MKKSILWKRRIGRAYSFLPQRRAPKQSSAVVLTYHSVGPTPAGLPEGNFRQQMHSLREHAAVVSLDRLLAGNWPDSESRVTCAITFDDGYASVYRHAFPILGEFQFPATVYLVAAAIGFEEPRNSDELNAGLYPNESMLRWKEVREMQENGLCFGSHLMHHKQLTTLSSGQAKEELEDSKKMIEDGTGVECGSFCYPWGKHDSRSVRQVKEAGYKNAVTAIHGRWSHPTPTDFYRIPRVDVRRDYLVEDFAAIVRGDWDFLGIVQKLRLALE